jgi:plastocyanin
MSLFSKFFAKNRRPIRKSSRRPAVLRPWLEQLEDRTVPTIVFNPQFGADTIEYLPTGQTLLSPMPAGSNLNVLNNPQVYLIFWGPSWNQTAPSAADIAQGRTNNAGKLAADAAAIISSNYLSGLQEYGINAGPQATFDGSQAAFGNSGDWTIDNSAIPTVPNGYHAGDWQDRDAEIEKILTTQMTTWTKPSGGPTTSPVYVLVFDQGDGGANNGGGDVYPYSKWDPSNPSNITRFSTITIDNGTNRDSFTTLLSHELVERISTGNEYQQGLKMNAPVNISGEYRDCQIADNEPDGGRYTYRLNGSNGPLVQAYWSIAQQAFVVPDGSAQNTVLDPIWNGNNFQNRFVSLEHGNLSWFDQNGNATAIESNVQSYSLDTAGNVFYLTNSGQVKEWSGSGAPTVLTDATLTATSLVRTNPFAFRANTWILAHKPGQPDQLLQYGGSPDSWNSVSGVPRNISALVSDGLNNIYVLGNSGGSNQVWQRDLFGNWTAITGKQTSIQQLTASLGSSPRIYILAQNPGQSELVYQYSGAGSDWGTGLAGQPSSISQIAPAYDGAYVLANSSVSRYWQAHTWNWSSTAPLFGSLGPEVGTWTNLTTVSDTIVSQIATSGYDLYMRGYNFFVDYSAGGGLEPQIYQYSGVGKSWNHLTQPPTNVSQLEVDGSNLYMLADNGAGTQFWHYSGTGLTWQPMNAAATSAAVTTQSALLWVTWANQGGDIGLTYTWSAIAKPNGAHPSFSANGTNAAQSITVTFDRPGNYTFQVTIRDPHGMTGTSTVNVTVVFPDLEGETFHFTSDTNPGTVTGTLLVQAGENFGTGGFQGFFSDIYDIPYAVSGTISNKGPSVIGGEYQAFNISFSGNTLPGLPGLTMSFSGTLHDNGPSLRWADDMRGTLTDAGPSVASFGTVDTATASSNPVNGTTVNLTVLDGDTQQLATLSYTWTTASAPNGAAPRFSSNAGQTTTVTFDMPGTYSFSVNISNGLTYSVNRTVNVIVNQALTSITVAPANVNILDGNGQWFTATTSDQFGHAMNVPLTWSLAPGSLGSIPIVGGSALYNAPVSGRGTDTIIATSGSVSGSATIHVLDGTTGIAIGALTDPQLTLDGQPVTASSSQRLKLTPGTHVLQEVNAGSVSFVVNSYGIVSYDGALEGILQGQNTDQLTVNGAAVSINAQALTDPQLSLDYYYYAASNSFQVRLLPGNHLLQEVSAGRVSFLVNPNGTVSYEGALEGILQGQNTGQLTVNGALVSINAQALTDPQLSLDYYYYAASNSFQARLLPGNHLLQEVSAGSLRFTVGQDGSISFADPNLLAAGIVSVNGNQLTVNGALVSINAQALTDPQLSLDYYYYAASNSFQARLLPGNHLLQEVSAGSISFTVGQDGSISLADPNLLAAGIVSVNGNQLTVNGAHVAIDARSLGIAYVDLDYYTTVQATSMFYVNLLPGTHRLQADGSAAAVNFTITDTGLIDYPTSLDTELSGRGTQTLTVNYLA